MEVEKRDVFYIKAQSGVLWKNTVRFSKNNKAFRCLIEKGLHYFF